MASPAMPQHEFKTNFSHFREIIEKSHPDVVSVADVGAVLFDSRRLKMLISAVLRSNAAPTIIVFEADK